MNFAFAKYMNSKVCQFTELCEKKHKSEVKKWNKTSHFYEEMLTYCFGLHWHSVQLKLLKQHENMAFLFLISRAGPSRYLFTYYHRHNFSKNFNFGSRNTKGSFTNYVYKIRAVGSPKMSTFCQYL